MAIFHDVKKKRFVFLVTHLFLIFVDKEIFFSRIYRDGMENVFHNILSVFQLAKIKHSSNNF